MPFKLEINSSSSNKSSSLTFNAEANLTIDLTDALLILGFKIAQIVSIIMIIIGIIILAKNKKKGRFEDLYNDTNNVDNLRF